MMTNKKPFTSNPRRGQMWRGVAKQLFDRRRPPCRLLPEELDKSLAEIVPGYVSGATREVMGRSYCAHHIRNAAIHSELNTGHYFAYTLRCVGPVRRRVWVMEPLDSAVIEGHVAEAVHKTIEWAKCLGEYYHESLPWERLPTYELKQVQYLLASTRRMLEHCESEALAQLAHQKEMVRALRGSIELLALPEEYIGGEEEADEQE